MSDSSTSSLRELRTLAAKAGGTHEDRIAELERRLGEAEARLQRRTDNVRSIVALLRRLAAHTGLPLTEVSNGNDPVSAPVPESESG